MQFTFFRAAALACFGLAVLCVVDASVLGTAAAAWGWGGLASTVLDTIVGTRQPAAVVQRPT